ncbi:hypothetical protein [Uliginosibacterium gangwonense]|uniref:hypothetical protein n=1 Tax=Uliginosibacterium gangwonense TaxID=392736 RepID=UPI0003A84D58|nr:hypothetical protein [Uliginosibacterium gangwonense]
MNISIQPYGRVLRISVCVALVVGVAVGSYLFGVHTSAPKPEVITAAPQERQSDQSVIAERKPESTPTKPPHKIPMGVTEERRVSIKLKPPAFTSPAGCQCDPAPLDVNLSLVQEEGGRRVIASSPEGRIISALDVPIEAALIPESHPWAAGISVGYAKTPGVWIERDLGRLRIGGEALRESGGGVQGRVRLGWVW